MTNIMTLYMRADIETPISDMSEVMVEEEVIVLGLETSCDETAAALVRLRHKEGALQGPGEILANIVLSQIDLHAPYGGVVPEIAARAHIEHMDRLVAEALQQAQLKLTDCDAIAATSGPGLIGGVLVGLTTGRALALAADKPFIGVNHLEGHALTVRLTQAVGFPYLLLLVSGGHCQLLGVEGLGRYAEMGRTRDDAVGEAFDKAAKLMSLGYPGGPEIEQWAQSGDAQAYALPRPLINDTTSGMDFSFSGLKTALRQQADKLAPLSDQHVADLAASFQAAILDCLCDRTARAMQAFGAKHQNGDALPLVAAGGVAANQALRARLDAEAAAHNFTLYVPPVGLCTDNAAMIAWAGAERLAANKIDPYAVAARPRWPLAEMHG